MVVSEEADPSWATDFSTNQEMLNWLISELTRDGVWRRPWFLLAGDRNWW